MAYFISFLKGIFALSVASVIIYYGLWLFDRWNYGFKGFIAALVAFPLVIFSATYVAEKLTMGKLGSMGSAFFMVLVLILYGGIYKINYEKKKVATYRSAASTLGLRYHKELNLPTLLAKNPALQRGFMPTVKNGFTGKYRGMETIVFNYEYEKLSGDYPDIYLRTAVAFSDPRIKLPEFYLKPQGLIGRLSKGKGIYFKEDPEFSKHYFLAGPDQKAVRKLFSGRQRQALFEKNQKWAVGSAEGNVVIYADDKMDEQVNPEIDEIKTYLEKTWTLYSVLSSAVQMSH